MLNYFLNIDQSIINTSHHQTHYNKMAICAYRVILTPSDDAQIRHFGVVKMLTEEEANTIREMIKDQVGKTVGRFRGGRLDGEEYEILSSCPNIYDIHKFFDGVKSTSVDFDTYFSEKEKRKAEILSQEKQTTKYQCSPAMATCDGLYDSPF